jgi:hypothetical protein
MKNKPSAYDLMLQAPDTMEHYFLEAIAIIDKQFGEGYARENPVLVAAFIQGCATDLNSMVLMNEIDESNTALRISGDALNSIASSIFTISEQS